MSTDEVYKIMEDSNGFLWIGTNAGVSRFDGTQFTNFQNWISGPDINEIGPILDLKIDSSQNRLWASGDYGVFTTLMDDVQFRRFESEFDFKERLRDRVSCMYIDESKNIWTANYMTGVSKIDIESREIENFRFKYDNLTGSKSLNAVKYISEDKLPNLIWLATEGGLIRFNTLTYEYDVYFFENDPGSPFNMILYLFADDKSVYLGTGNDGLIIFDKSTKEFHRTSSHNIQESYDRTLDLYVEQDQFLWVTTYSGLTKYNLKTDSLEVTLKHDLSNDIVRGVSFVDSRGIIWFWSRDGLFRYNTTSAETPLIQLEKRNFLEKPMEVRNIIVTQDFTYVLGLRSSGLYQINKSNQEVKTFSLGQKHDANLRDMAEMEDGKILLISFDSIFIFNPENEKFIHSPLQVDHAHPTFQTLARDQTNRYWIGSNVTGLYCLDFKQKTVRNYRKEFDTFKSENHRWIHNLFIDSKNNLWIAKGSNTLFNLQKDSILCLNPNDTTVLTYSVVNEFCEDSNGRIWMAAYEEGLGFTNIANFDRGVNHTFDGNFEGVYQYSDSMLITIGNGIGLLNTEKLEHQQIPLNFDVSQLVLRGPVVNDGNDRYIIGCNNGVLVYDPHIISTFSRAPEPYIREIEANGETVFRSEDLAQRAFRFDKDIKHLNIQLSAFDFQQNSKIYYQYRTQKNWIDLKESQSINFTDLNHGKFSLEIKACHDDGQCNREPVKYVIEIIPPWFKTKWAIALFISTAIGIFYFIYKLRVDRKFERQEALRLKELDEFKTRFYANITHEFRTPLTVIGGLADELKSRPDKEPNKKIDLITRNSQGLLSLINQILDLSKLQTGILNTNVRQGDIIPFIRYVTIAHESLAKMKNIDLDFSSVHSSLIMDFDADKLERVMTNLISNAIKFTPDFGSIKVSGQKTGSPNNEKLQILVHDNGIGIPKDQLPQIFDRFYQADFKAKRQGTGIGLALAKELVEVMHGKIGVESEEKTGSTFKIELPIENNAPLAANLQSAQIEMVADEIDLPTQEVLEDPDKKELPILLVVEDNLDVIYYLKTCLEADYQIIFSQNGQEGIDLAIETVPDIIISDVMMPEKDGFELCATLKEDERTSHIPIILLTAKATSEDRINGLSHGADAYLIKPFNRAELFVRLQKLREIRETLQKKYSGILFNRNDDSNFSKTNEDLFLEKAEKIMLENLQDEDFSLVDFARAMNLSRSQVHRKLKALTGNSTSIYIRMLRLEKARELLLSDELSISEVAYKVGFKSPVYFSQIFKQTFGKSPSESRL